jgi:rSAM/selenodomain-associated transferase 2
MKPKISVIIPALNEADSIGETIARLGGFSGAEIIVADGGSSDETVRIAESLGATVIETPRGRGSQLAAGAREAKAEVFWFLHADTLAPNDAVDRIFEALSDERIAGGNFAIKFQGGSFWPRFLTWLYPKLRFLGLSYGDSAFFARRAAYEKIGGFRDLAIFEDLDFIRRLRKAGRLVTVRSFVETSSRRFEKKSFALVFLRWTILQVLYWFGVPPDKLMKIYFRQ